MNVLIKLVAIATACASISTQAALIESNGSNHSLDTAQSLNGFFTTELNSEIIESTTSPHASVRGVGQDAFDFYSFTVTGNNVSYIFDIDYGMPNLDSWLNLYDASGNILAQSDDAPMDPGSAHRYDSYMHYRFAAAGDYIISVGRFPNSPLRVGQDYILNVSANVVAVPEPETYAMLVAGLLAVGFARRRRTA